VQSVNFEETEKGKKFDLGAHWVGRNQAHIMSITEEFKLPMCPQYLEGTKIMQTGESKARTYNSVLPNVGSWFALADLGWMLSKLEKLAAEVNILDPYKGRDGPELDSITVHSWVKSNTRYEAVKDVLTAAFRCTFGVEPAQMSMLYFLTVCKSAGGVDKLFESTEGAGQEFTVEGGTASIVDSLAKDIEKDVNILIDQPVNTVEQNDDGSVCVLSGAGRIFRCRHVIVCIPPNQQSKIIWTPGLPSMKKFAMQSSQMGVLIKFLAVYAKCHWKEAGFSGELVSSGGGSLGEECEGSPICITFDDSNEKEFALVGFIGGKLGVQWAEMPEKFLEEAILNHLAECFGSWAYDNKSLTVKNWVNEPFIEGSPACVPHLGTMQAFATLRTSVGNVHFGGTEAATAWIGYMNGAVESGVRAALEVLQHIKPQSLSSNELMVLQRHSTKQAAVPLDKPGLCRWTVLMPLVYVMGMAVMYHLRDHWSHCFIPFR